MFNNLIAICVSTMLATSIVSDNEKIDYKPEQIAFHLTNEEMPLIDENKIAVNEEEILDKLVADEHSLDNGAIYLVFCTDDNEEFKV